MRLATVVLMGAAVAVAACGGAKLKPNAADTSTGIGELEGIRRTADSVGRKRKSVGKAGMMVGGTMDSMQAHMRVMDTMSAAGMKARLPMHQR